MRRFRDQEYWGKPLPGFGDINAELLVVGLAPAAHGGTRVGRMFTGDSSADWLVRALYETGFANQPVSESKNDGLVLTNAYWTNPVRCAPPQNKPTAEEMNTCRPYMEQEIKLMKNLKVLVALGKIGFDNTCKVYQIRGLKFGHNVLHELPDGKKLLASYHPSKQNTQTGRLKWEDWLSIFVRVNDIIKNDESAV